MCGAQEFMKRLLPVRSFFMYFFSLSAPQQFYNMDVIILSPFELLRKLSQKDWIRFTLDTLYVNSRVGIWSQVYPNWKHCGPGCERVSHSLVISPLGACFLLCEMKTLVWEVTTTTCLLSLLHQVLKTQVFCWRSKLLGKQTMWKSICLSSCHFNFHLHTWAHNSIIFKL